MTGLHTPARVASLACAALVALGCGSVPGDEDAGADAGATDDAAPGADAPTARFDVTIEVLGDGAGTVTLSPGQSCSSTCTQTFAHGTEVTVSVAADDGSFFAGFGGDCAGTDACTLIVDDTRSVSATFAAAVVFQELAEGDENSLVIPQSGAPYVFFHGPTPTNGNPDLVMLRCDDPACSSFITDPLETAGDTGLDPTALLDADDLPVVAYHQSDFGGEAKIRRCNDADCDSTSSRFFENTGDGRWSSIVLDAAGLATVVYVDASSGTVDLARCDDVPCSSFTRTPQVITAAAERLTLINGSDGRLAFAYYDRSLGALRFTHCNDDDCTSVSTVTIDGGPDTDAGAFLAAAIGADGFPLFAYYDATNGDLELARCSNAACTSQSVLRRIDGADTDLGTHVSMVVPPDGRPVIAYYDETLGDLKVARCDDPQCSTSSARRVAGEFADVGRFTSIALDPDGLPVIVFEDVDTGLLTLARCQTPSCGL